MVGVAGKYKGCNTCRARRIKCDNNRPLCNKCTNSGRECGGYDRKTVFIVGTQEDKGRCASHPRREVARTRGAGSASTSPSDASPRMVSRRDSDIMIGSDAGSAQSVTSPRSRLQELFDPATVAHEIPNHEPWQVIGDNTILLSSAGTVYRAHLTEVPTLDFDSTVESIKNAEQGLGFGAPLLAACQLPGFCPALGFAESLPLRSRCLVYLPSNGQNDMNSSPPDGLCLFVYEYKPSPSCGSGWQQTASTADAQSCWIRRQGPAAFQTFPNHHYFARVYRLVHVWAAVLNRQPTFLCSPEWTVVPWEKHFRTPIDSLFDIAVLLPMTFSEIDHMLKETRPELRRSKSRLILKDCANIASQFDMWHRVAQRVAADESSPLLYWQQSAVKRSVPFADTYAFSSQFWCVAHIYYWAFLLSLHEGIQTVREVMSEGQDGPTASTDTSQLRFSISETRRLAENVCRSLDFALENTLRPHVIPAPLSVVRKFYERIKDLDDCELEINWCREYESKLEGKCQDFGEWMKEMPWVEMGSFG